MVVGDGFVGEDHVEGAIGKCKLFDAGEMRLYRWAKLKIFR
jgi:hypothetical protein